jgi:tetratricopeptide (TPR) repeat protein
MLARVANRFPEHMPYLVDYCRRHVNAHVEQLIQVAQEGEGALGQALTLLWRERSFDEINERIFLLLPERTIQLRDFTVELLKQMISANQEHLYGLNQRELRAILSGRLREAGRFEEALSEARKLVEDANLAAEPPELQAFVWGNLAVSYADVGNWAACYEAHRQAMQFYQALGAEKSTTIAKWLAGQCINVAAAAMKLELWPEAETWSRQGLKLAGKLADPGLLLRAQLVRVVFLSETGKLAEALALGEPTLESARDLEEVDQQSYAALLIDVYLNLGSILLDLHKSKEAAPYFATANEIAANISKQAPSIATRNKLVISTVAVAHAQIVQGERQGLEQARTALAEARSLYEESRNDYQKEIVLRAIEVNVSGEIEFDCKPDFELVEELIGPSNSLPSGPLTQEETEAIQRRLHLASMALAKLELKDRALSCAQEAVRLANLEGENYSTQQEAQRGVLHDGLSRRLEETERSAEAMDLAEAACRILLPVFLADQETYQDWMWKFMERFRELAIKLDRFDYFQRFFAEEFEPRYRPQEL